MPFVVVVLVLYCFIPSFYGGFDNFSRESHFSIAWLIVLVIAVPIIFVIMILGVINFIRYKGVYVYQKNDTLCFNGPIVVCYPLSDLVRVKDLGPDSEIVLLEMADGSEKRISALFAEGGARRLGEALQKYIGR
jgi:hypothetical protein